MVKENYTDVIHGKVNVQVGKNGFNDKLHDVEQLSSYMQNVAASMQGQLPPPPLNCLKAAQNWFLLAKVFADYCHYCYCCLHCRWW